MLSTEYILKTVEAETAKIYFDMQPRSLFVPIEYILSIGGKHIRPALTLIACNIFSEAVDNAIKPALGLEVFHNFTLLHDDLMDQADKRRNRPTVHKKWNNNTAILSGDAMVIAAYRLISETPEPHLKKVLDLFSQTAMEICCGQQYDMDFEQRNDVREDEYIEMIRLKTAVLMACCLKTGAIVGGAREKDADRLYRFGINIGLAFQLQDDLLDVYGDSATFGKNIGGDILCDKKTFLLINALRLANPSQKAAIERFKDGNSFEPLDKITTYTDIYNTLNIKDITLKKIDCYYQLAMKELESLEAEPASLIELNKFAKMLTSRET